MDDEWLSPYHIEKAMTPYYEILINNQIKKVWRHSSTELSNGFATQSAISTKRKADVPNVPLTSVLPPNVRKNACASTVTVHLINACVVGISKGN